MDRINNQKVTVGFKVTKAEKLRIEETAAQCGMNNSQYLGALVFEKHEKLNQRIHLVDDLIIPREYQPKILAKVRLIRQQFPKKSAAEIFSAALSIAIKNEKLVTKNKLKNFL